MKNIKLKPRRSYLRFIIPAAGLVVLACLGLFFLMRPRPVWVVEAQYEAAWRRLLASSDLPQSWQRVLAADGPGADDSRFGYRISTRHGEEEAGTGIRALYPYLSQTGEYKGALALAADPWLVFRSNTTLPLSRSRAEGSGAGTLFMAGRDPMALAGWTAQLLQQRPGVFAPWGEQWTVTSESLFLRRHFQPGAQTYTWGEIWPQLIDSPSSWAYAPLSAAQQLPGYRLSLLEADRFPEKEDWNEFSLQAQILWAIPFGAEKGRSHAKALAKAAAWLQDAQTQSDLSSAIGWIPANREARPYNPIAHSAQLAWLGSSYIWEASLPSGGGE